MKSLYIIAVTCFFILSTSCSKNSSGSSNFFKCTISNNSGIENLSGSQRGVNFDCYFDTHSAILIGGVGSINSVDVILNNIKQPGTYNFAEYSNTVLPFAEIDVEDAAHNVYNSNPSGSVVITKVSSNSVEGTFSVVSESAGGAICTITNGSFAGVVK